MQIKILIVFFINIKSVATVAQSSRARSQCTPEVVGSIPTGGEVFLREQRKCKACHKQAAFVFSLSFQI